jgi:thioredoxin reductase (NADPH)
MYDVLIIGGGPAGIYCGYVAHNKGLKAILVESNDSLGGQPLLIYSQKPIYDYPAFCGIKAYELTNKLIDQLVNHSETKVLLKTTIKSYSKEDKLFKVTLTNNEVIETKAIIIACGGGIFKPNRLENISSENKNIHYLVQPLDVYKNKKVVVLGGGDSAVD